MRLSARAAGLAMAGLLAVAGAGFLAFGRTAEAQTDIAAAGPAIDLSGYERTFSEDFDSLDVTPWGATAEGSRWIAHTPWAGDFGDAQFADPQPGYPFTLHDGVLRIEARKRPDGKWESGLLAANDPRGRGFSQRYGYFEARMKFPPGKGVWPAFWLMGNAKPGFASEIDVVEYYGHDPSIFHTVWHIWREEWGKPNEGEGHMTKVPPGSLSDDFHTYGVDVAEDKVRFYFDRREIWSMKTPDEYKMPFYPLVNLALGSGWPIDETPNPSYLWVDYVHVYQRKPAP
ncbi:hypothetical protein GCM10011390_13250 [Aureimonas endophytica]|uniref:GH16 domain-containing protein n=1 Tax=Aureimonas endophytica TaxID=2027858 RepID=A0A917E2T9_9HYPH|nr:glycoside hydrolase family 16 protein [Aureimonas endophytica]GGD95830.1 hypothetical protein GCM10011390_13250 [Aureimonas endophytica]